MNVKELEFNYEQTPMGKDGKIPCWIITANLPASFDYFI